MADVLEVSDDTFDAEVLKSELPVLVDFWAPWCGPCKMMAPVVDQMATTYAGRLKVVKCNVDDAPNSATQNSVRAIPTLALVKGGKNVEVLVGVQSAADLAKKIDGLLEA